MTVEDQHENRELDEGSWIYLSTGSEEDAGDPSLREELAEACARSGWTAVTHPAPENAAAAAESSQFLASVSHAVEHADAVVAVIGPSSEMADAELTFAYDHGRPIVAVRVGGTTVGSEAWIRLAEYERARLVACESPKQCAISLREVLSDPLFAETIREAG